MKRMMQFFLIVVFCALFTNVVAQTYKLTVSNKPFVFLTEPQSAVEGPWDVPEFQIPIGFDFEFFDITSNQFYSIVNSFGGVFELNLNLDHLYMLIPLNANMIDRGFQQDSALSPVNYKTEGIVGQRIFTLEFKEAGLYNGLESIDGIFLEYISFQLRLFEDSGDIEFQIGPYSIETDPETLFDPIPGPIVGLLADVESTSFGAHIGEYILLKGNALKPTIATDSVAFLTWPIPENTVYRFSRMNTSVVEHLSPVTQTFFFPNPTSGEIRLNENIAKDINYPIIVFDVLGKQIDQWNAEAEISAAGLSAGSYYVIVQTKNKLVTEKLLVLPD